MPEFKTRFEKDPYDIKFLTENLPQSKTKRLDPIILFMIVVIVEKIILENISFALVHGLPKSLPLRDVDPTHQMGDLVKKPEPYYDPELILPRLPFPNKFYGYTRHRPLVRSVTSAFWDRALPKLAEQWKNEKVEYNIKGSSPPPSSPAPSPASSTSSLISTSDISN